MFSSSLRRPPSAATAATDASMAPTNTATASTSNAGGGGGAGVGVGRKKSHPTKSQSTSTIGAATRTRRSRSTYRSARAVTLPTHVMGVTEWTRLKGMILLLGICVLAIVMLSPIYMFEMVSENDGRVNGGVDGIDGQQQVPHDHDPDHPLVGQPQAQSPTRQYVGLASLLHKSQQIRSSWKQVLQKEQAYFRHELEQDLPLFFQQHPVPPSSPDAQTILPFHELQQQNQPPQQPSSPSPPSPPSPKLKSKLEPPPQTKNNNEIPKPHDEPPKSFVTPPIQLQVHSSTVRKDNSSILTDKASKQKPTIIEDKKTHTNSSMAALSSSSSSSSKTSFVLARGVSGLPMSKTPALIGAQRGHIQCDVDVDELLAYWNEPVGTRDLQFQTPFAASATATATATAKSVTEPKFLTFEPDQGGWNNIRMSFENLVILAAATGRTLVLPPKAPFYLLAWGKEGARTFGSFFSMDTVVSKRISIITMSEFLTLHGTKVLNVTQEELKQIQPLGNLCLYQRGGADHCQNLWKHFRPVGWQPQFKVSNQCLIFDEDVFHGKKQPQLTDAARVARFCGKERTPMYVNDTWTKPQLLHWNAAGVDEYRLLDHFYTAMFFTNPVIDNYMKRLIRDTLHYNDEIHCVAGKIIRALHDEFPVMSSWHVRRGDFQFKLTRLTIEEWYNNTKSFLQEGEALYIATDEGNRTFFAPLTERYGHPVKFLDDFNDMFHLKELDPAYLGMIDTIVASHGRTFTGTWFSTFSGYINRLRGYRGISMKHSWYSWSKRRTKMHTWEYPTGNYYAREWPIAWVGIDGDELVEQELMEHDTHQETHEDNAKGGEPQEEGDLTDGEEDEEVEEEEEVEVELVDRKVPKLTLSVLEQDMDWTKKPVARGVSGRPLDRTPALVGAARAHVRCDINVDSVAYWNDPQGHRDRDFKSPFAVEGGGEKYITFGMDRGGWNNVRMCMEIIFVIALVTGRTLVLPPEIKLYLLHHDTGHKTRSFADFFPLHTEEFNKRLKIITMKDFIAKEGGPSGRVPLPPGINGTIIQKAADHCDNRAKSDRSCMIINSFLESSGFNPGFRAADGCVVFDVNAYHQRPIEETAASSAKHFCGKRDTTYWTKATMNDIPIIHFHGDDKHFRLLTHFYSILHFTDPAMDNYVKRFVRDFLHYHDVIYCAAGKIVKALQYEGKQRRQSQQIRQNSQVVDDEGSGGYSAMHVRRGDLQYKKVKLPARIWWNNTKELWNDDEILYIATDERNLSWFNPIARKRPIRFLSDYWDLADLGSVDPNYMGMIDTIVASRGRVFVGTWFSTFSGYINRMRGYHGLSMFNSWYSFLPRKTALHNWTDVDTYAYAYEWPAGWAGIDADVVPSKERY